MEGCRSDRTNVLRGGAPGREGRSHHVGGPIVIVGLLCSGIDRRRILYRFLMKVRTLAESPPDKPPGKGQHCQNNHQTNRFDSRFVGADRIHFSVPDGS